jgi:hypothetical protein
MSMDTAFDPNGVDAAPLNRLIAFSRLAMGKAVLCAALGAAALGGISLGTSTAERWSAWQHESVSQGYFTGTVKVESSVVDLRGDHALINPLYHKEPAIVAEKVFSGFGEMLDLAHWEWDQEMKSKMTFFHERSHVEYQTSMGTRFDAPGISPVDRSKFQNSFDANDSGRYEHLRTRLHGAMHERFAEAYAALSMARIYAADPEQSQRIQEFFARRVKERKSDIFGNAKEEFAHKLGLDMEAAMEASRDPSFAKLAPNQVKALALRVASLAYVVDAKSDAKLEPIISSTLEGASSKALWSSAGTIDAKQIAKRSLENLPEANLDPIDVKPLDSNKLGSRAKVELKDPQAHMSKTLNR